MLSTLFHDGEIIAVLKHSVKVILLCCVVEIIIDNRRLLFPFLYAIRDITLLLFILNLITCFIWKNGIPDITADSSYPYYLFGNVNTTIRVVLPGMMCSSIIDQENNRKLPLHLLIYSFGFLYIYLNVYPTTTTLIALFIILIWILFEWALIKHFTQTYFAFVCLILFLELMVVVVSNTKLIDFIADLFNKSSDFTGRAILWQRAISSVKNHFLIGVGRQNLTTIYLTIGNTSGSHNYFLDLLYQSGLCGFTSFISIVVFPIIMFRKSFFKTWTPTKINTVYVIVGYCMSLLAMFLSEPFYEYEYYFVPIFYSLLILICKEYKSGKELNYEI